MARAAAQALKMSVSSTGTDLADSQATVTAIQIPGPADSMTAPSMTGASRRDAVVTRRLGGGDLTKQPELLPPRPRRLPKAARSVLHSYDICGTSRDKIRSMTSAPVVMTGRSSWR